MRCVYDHYNILVFNSDCEICMLGWELHILSFDIWDMVIGLFLLCRPGNPGVSPERNIEQSVTKRCDDGQKESAFCVLNMFFSFS